MSIETLFPGIQDFLVLTAKGYVGRVESGQDFRVFKRLSESVENHARVLLESRRQHPDDEDIRPAIVIPPMPSRKWRSASLVYSDRALLRLFPSGAAGNPNNLTPFAARNRERSIYQGIELLIAYENKSMPGVAFYCPVLYGEVGKLGDFPSFSQSLSDDVPSDTPVIEVLNFIALLSPAERMSEWARELVRLIQNISIQTAKRASSPFSIAES